MEKISIQDQHIHDIQSKLLLLYEDAFAAARMHNIALSQSCLQEINDIYPLWHKIIFASLDHPRSLSLHHETILYHIAIKQEKLKHYF